MDIGNILGIITTVIVGGAVFIRAGRLIQIVEDTRGELKEHKVTVDTRFKAIEARR